MLDFPAELFISWSPHIHREWDGDAEAYVRAGIVDWGRTRRLGKAADPARHFKAYLGVRHFDPGQWGLAGEPAATFFLSLFLLGQTVALRTYPTLDAALAALCAFHATLPVPPPLRRADAATR